MEPDKPNWVIHAGNVNDAGKVWALQKRAFQDEARLYDDPRHPALVQTLGELVGEFRLKLFLTAWLEGEIVGSIRAYQLKDTCYVSRLMVEPEAQGQGIGKGLMERIEQQFPAAERFELFTGDRNRRVIQFYKRLGYRILKSELVSKKLTLVYLEKKKTN